MPEYADIPIDPTVELNLHRLKHDLGGADDLIMREIRYEGMRFASATVVYIDGLANAMTINQYIFDVLDYSLSNHRTEHPSAVDAGVLAKKSLSGMGAISTVSEMASL